MNEAITVKDGQAAVNVATVAGSLSPKASATDIITVVEAADGTKHAALKVVGLGGGGGGEVGGDYLPLSGGTMTGTLASDVPDYTNSLKLPGFSVQRRGQGVLVTFGASLVLDCGSVNDWSPFTNNSSTLGRQNKSWTNVYTTKLNNGEDIAIPTEGGTMARIEDIDAAVGDISAALTAILGE